MKIQHKKGGLKECPACKEHCIVTAFECRNCGYPFAPYYSNLPVRCFDISIAMVFVGLVCLWLVLDNKDHVDIPLVLTGFSLSFFGTGAYAITRIIHTHWYNNLLAEIEALFRRKKP